MRPVRGCSLLRASLACFVSQKAYVTFLHLTAAGLPLRITLQGMNYDWDQTYIVDGDCFLCQCCAVLLMFDGQQV